MRILSLFIHLEFLELKNRIIHSYLELHVFKKSYDLEVTLNTLEDV